MGSGSLKGFYAVDSKWEPGPATLHEGGSRGLDMCILVSPLSEMDVYHQTSSRMNGFYKYLLESGNLEERTYTGHVYIFQAIHNRFL